jgi:SNF2 family DNA or RNA helicase
MIDSTIKVDFSPKDQKLLFTGGFHLLDVFRAFPSRRFDPKTKTWKAPLTKQNVLYFGEISRKFTVVATPAAKQAIEDLDRLTAKPVYTPVPRLAFVDQPYAPLEHQWDMMDKGWGLKAYALFAAMGTGKTFVTVNLARIRFVGGIIDRFIVICPETLRSTWRREFAQYAPGLTDCWNLGDGSVKAYTDWCKDTDRKKLKVLLVSVEGLGISQRLYDLVYAFIPSHRVMVVADESSRIKNPDALRTERAIGIASNCEYRMVLNGTPIAKGIQDLWSQYQFLDPNIIGSGDYWAFKTRYVVKGGYDNKQIIGYTNLDELMSLLQPYTLEVNKKILKLPEKMYKTMYVKPTPEQLRLFEKVLTGIGEGPMIKAQNVLERMLRLQQIIGGFEPQTTVGTVIDPETHEEIESFTTVTVPLEKNPKMDALLDLIAENQHGNKFVIWARYVPEIETIVRALGKVYGDECVVSYYGATSSDDRTAAEDRYCRDPRTRFLVGNPAAAGLGLTFISGENDVMVYYSGTFAYIDRAQSEDRSHRIGQNNPTLVMDLVMEGTLDLAIQASIREKKDMDVFVKESMAAGKSVRALVYGD